MSRVRVLFIPAVFGLPSHFVPLLKLYQRLDPNECEAAFLLPDPTEEQILAWQLESFNANARYYYGGEFLSHFGVPRLATKQTLSVVTELAAYREFSPDLIIDDCSLTTALARQMCFIPRATLLRTGTFPGCSYRRTPGHRHSAQGAFESLTLPRQAPFKLPQEQAGYFAAEAYLVPGVRSLESIPHAVEAATPTLFCGPLLLDEHEERIFHSGKLEEFLLQSRGRRLAYVTFGVKSASRAHENVVTCCRELLGRGFSLITNLALERHCGADFMRTIAGRHFFATVLPMHRVCESVDLVIHVCSSGAYQYPILHRTPAITIGTRYYDREEVAETLAARGLSRHLPAPEETEDFCALFNAVIDDFCQSRPPFDAGFGRRIKPYRDEMELAAQGFDFAALARSCQRRTRLDESADPRSRCP